MTDGRTWTVFRAMLREEWRLHSDLFDGRRFAAFPVFVALVCAGTTWLLVRSGTRPATVFAGLHALAFVFGLHTGSIGFVGRDALRNLLGEVNLLVFSARTLPLSQRRLLGVFVLKDVVYYAALFLMPLTLGAGPALLASVGATGTLPAASRLWTTLTLTFVLGIGTTIAALGLSGRGVPRVALLGAAVGAAALLWHGGVDAVAYTPYGAFLSPTLPRVGVSLAAVLAVFAVGALTFDGTVRESGRTARSRVRPWSARVGDPVAAKTLLDVHRSSGGFGKVLFSAAVLFGVTAALVSFAGRLTGVEPSVGVSFGTVLGLSGFTTYNWLTQADDATSYRVYPLTVADVFAAKFRAFLLLGPAVGLAVYALAVVWKGSPPGEALTGAVLLVGVACYIFGVTAYLAGLSPNEFLFDTPLFALFGVAMVVPLVPVLTVGFVLAPLSTPLLGALGAGGVALAAVGHLLYRRSLPRWTRHHREAVDR